MRNLHILYYTLRIYELKRVKKERHHFSKRIDLSFVLK